MKTKLGVKAIIFADMDGERVFLLMHRVLNWSGWEFVKGGMEEGEDPVAAIKREISEEAGIVSILSITGLQEKNQWQAGGMNYVYDAFAVEVPHIPEIKLADHIVEHDDFKWCSAETALGLLTYENDKGSFRQALSTLDALGAIAGAPGALGTASARDAPAAGGE